MDYVAMVKQEIESECAELDRRIKEIEKLGFQYLDRCSQIEYVVLVEKRAQLHRLLGAETK